MSTRYNAHPHQGDQQRISFQVEGEKRGKLSPEGGNGPTCLVKSTQGKKSYSKPHVITRERRNRERRGLAALKGEDPEETSVWKTRVQKPAKPPAMNAVEVMNMPNNQKTFREEINELRDSKKGEIMLGRR